METKTVALNAIRPAHDHVAAMNMLRHMAVMARDNVIILRDLSRSIWVRNNGVTGPYYFAPGPLITGRDTVPEGFSGYLNERETAIDEGAHVRLRVTRADEIIRLNHTGWFVDDECAESMFGVVATLPRSRGFLAGWSLGAQMATSFSREIYENAEEAARAADREAEHAAERERIAARIRDDDDGYATSRDC